MALEIPKALLKPILFPAPRETEGETPSEAGLDYQELTIETADGESLRGWWIKTQTHRRGHLLFFHGNGEDISGCIPYAELLTGIGFDVMLFDYRGYGESSGRSTEEGTYLDAEAARACLLAQPRVNRKRVFYFGRSLGGAIALKLACEHPPAGLILLSAFASPRAVARDWYPQLPDVLVRRIPDIYPSLSRIGDLRVPVLILHGRKDETVPHSHAEKLFKAAHQPKKKRVFRRCGHDDVFDLCWEDLEEVIVAWQEGLTTPKSAPAGR